MFISGGQLSPYKPVLLRRVKPNSNFKMVSKSIQDPLDHPGHTPYVRPDGDGCVLRSPTSDEI